MKKLILLTTFLASTYIFSQGKINIFNFSAYNLTNTLAGSNANANCYPSVSGTNYPIPVPPQTSLAYSGYYNSGTSTPPITSWTIYSANGSVTTLPHNSPVLNIAYASNTTWQLNKFFVTDPSGAPLPNSGESIGTITCGTLPITYVGGPSTLNPFEAFWFISGGENYFVIQ